MQFGGAGRHVNLGTQTALRLQAFTLEAWVRPLGAGGTASSGSGGIQVYPIVAKGRGESDSPSSINTNYLFGLDASFRLAIDFEEAAGRNRPLRSKSAIPLNTWTHVAVTYDPAPSVYRIYINGKQDTTKDMGSNILPTNTAVQPAAIGAALNSNGVVEGWFNGAIDEVRIWNKVRSASELLASYNNEFGSGTGLVARFGLNENSGVACANSTGLTNPGQLVSSVSWTYGYNQNATNNAPVLAQIGSSNGKVGLPFSFTASANDPDAGQVQIFTLLNAPSGATIDPVSGVFNWTPLVTGSYQFTVRSSDNGAPQLYDEEVVTLVVTEPVFANSASAAIPNPGLVQVPITVSGLPSSIDTVHYGLQSVLVNITHPALKELTLQLKSPDGKIIYLSRKSPGVNYTNTIFNAVSQRYIDVNERLTSYTGSYSSNYRPRQDLSLLNNGQNPNGTWYLLVRDDNAASTAGTVSNVSLTFGTKPALPLLTVSNIPIIKIYTENGADILDDPKVLADMYIVNNAPGELNSMAQTTYQYQGKIGIEIRGNTSANNPRISKKQYGFETMSADGLESIDVSLFGMPKQSDWVLSAVMTDRSLMRNVLTYQLAREMGWWASRTQFCELVINDEYRGVFVFQERVKRDKNRVPIEKLETTDITHPNISGGYLFAVDDAEPGMVSWQTKIAPKFRPFQFVYPKAENVVPQQKAYLQSYVDSFEAALHGPNFQDPAVGFRRFADDKSFIDFFLISEVAKNNDSYRFSTFFYKKRGGKIVAMPVWDFDRAFRNESTCNSYRTYGYIYQQANGCGSIVVPWWWSRLLEDAQYKKDMICRYNSLRQTTLSLQRMYAIIDSAAAVLNAGAQQRNFIRWNNLGKNVISNASPYPATYALEIDTLKNWIANRLEWLDNDLGSCEQVAPTVTKRSDNNSFSDPNGTAAAARVFPSPFRDQLSLALNLDAAQSLTIELVDAGGKVAYRQAVKGQKGSQVIRLDVGGRRLTNGIYLVRVKGSSVSLVQKVLKE